jgi:2-polyprenyl-3-methyl-5-hydroxy-6-metoxy-1,4-benzoquinol methylase
VFGAAAAAVEAYLKKRGTPLAEPNRAGTETGVSSVAFAEHYRCRSCAHRDLQLIVDLGSQPFANSFLSADALSKMEPTYPLPLLYCPHCHLVQIPAATDAHAIFSDYLYMSSFSQTWLDHARDFVEQATQRFGLGPRSRVIEIASNDGYLLQFVCRKGIPALGIEPAANVAKLAEQKGVPTRVAFFGTATARALVAEGLAADLTVANNVLAHVPDLNDFVGGFAAILKSEGVATFEFPHLANLIGQTQFDTIYHEHFSYISLIAARTFFQRHELRIFDVEKLPTHGGSLRLFVCRDGAGHQTTPAVSAILEEERRLGLDRRQTYRNFAGACRRIKNDLMKFLIAAAEDGKLICGYGAPAKGNTLLNFCGARTDLIAFTVDRNPHKQNHFLPGTHIPILSPDEIAAKKPDYLLILPWNIKTEICEQMHDIRGWGGKFVVAVPELTVF